MSKSFCGTEDIVLFDCPFCGGRPELIHIGNEYTKSRKIEIKCGGCRVKRVNAARIHGFKWLEDVSAKQWNQRPCNSIKEQGK